MIDAIDLSTCDNLPPKQEFILPDWLPIGGVSSLSGEYEVGKSLFVQQLMTAAATGKPWLGIDIKKIKTYGVFCEDDEEELWRRQCAINEFYQLNMKSPDFINNICFSSRVGEDNLLMVFNNKSTGQLTPYFQELLEDIKLFQPKLVVLDSNLDLFGGDENNYFHFKKFIQNCCAHIARTVNCAVLLCKHDSGIEVWNEKIWYLSRSEEASDERILHCGRSSHLLRYQDNVFVI